MTIQDAACRLVAGRGVAGWGDFPPFEAVVHIAVADGAEGFVVEAGLADGFAQLFAEAVDGLEGVGGGGDAVVGVSKSFWFPWSTRREMAPRRTQPGGVIQMTGCCSPSAPVFAVYFGLGARMAAAPYLPTATWPATPRTSRTSNWLSRRIWSTCSKLRTTILVRMAGEILEVPAGRPKRLHYEK